MGYVIIGAGGHAKVVIDIIRCMEKKKTDSFPLIQLLDDNVEIGTEINGCRVVGQIRECNEFLKGNKFIIGIGDNYLRRQIAENYLLPYVKAIHPSTVLGSGVRIGDGSVIMAGTVINAESKIGRQCIINTGATVDHECEIGDFVHISPGGHLGGNVKIGAGSWIGMGVCVKNNIFICDKTIVGAGGIVINDVNKNGVYVGNPVKYLNYQKKVGSGE